MRGFGIILKGLVVIMIMIGATSVVGTSLEMTLGICSIPMNFINNVSGNETVDETLNKRVDINQYKDMIEEVFLDEGHPSFYGKINNIYNFANKFQNNIVAVDIVGGEKFNEYTNQTCLYVRGYEYNDVVTDIEINLENMDEDFNEKEAINLAKSYLNNDVIKECFEESEYEMYVPEDKSQSTYKVLTYELNQKGMMAQDSGEFEFMGRFFVTLEERNNKVIMIRMHDITSIPNWMSKPKFNGYEVVNWSIN